MRIIDRLVTVLGYQYDTKGLARFEKGLNRAQARLDAFAVKTRNVGLALTGAAIGTLRPFTAFESKMAEIEGLVGISRDQLKAWEGDIAAIARETGQSPVQLAEALFFVTSAGLRGEEAMSILRASAKAAAVGLGEQADIVDLLTGAMNIYGPEVLSASRATDTLVKAIKEGKLEASTLGPALSAVLPFAAEVGVEYEEIAGALAAMSRQNIGARRGATALRGVFNKLIRPTEMGKEALEEAGLSADWLRRKVADEGLLTALLDLRAAFGGNSEQIGRVFEDSEALLGVLALTNQTAEDNATIIDSVADAHGALDFAVGAAERTLRFQWRRAMATAEAALIGIGAELAPTAKKIIDFAQTGITWFDNLSSGWRRFIAVVLSAGPALLAVAVAAKLTSIALGVLNGLVKVGTGLFTLFTTATFRTRLGLLGLAIAQKLAAAAQWLLNAAMTANPIGILIVGIAALVAGLVVLAKNIGGVRDKLFGFFQRVPDWAQALAGPIGWISLLIEHFDKIRNVVEGVMNWLRNLDWSDIGRRLMQTLVDGIKNVPIVKQVSGVLGGIRKLLPFSDAKEGPLSDLSESGRRFAMTLAAGVRAGAGDLTGAVSDSLGLVPRLPVGPAPQTLAGGAAPAGSTTHISISLGGITIQTTSGDAREIADEVEERLDRKMRAVAEEFDSVIKG